MQFERALAIEAWFAKCADDGEFVRPTRSMAYPVIWPMPKSEFVLFTTKPGIVTAAFDACDAAEHLSVIGRYGLPTEHDLYSIREVVGSRKILFLGDMDPPDLMIFAWLRDRLGPSRIDYLGVGDKYLTTLDLSAAPALTMPCAASERRALPVLQTVLPDLSAVVGPECFRILELQRKLELEAIVSAKQAAAAVLLPAIAASASETRSAL